MDYRRHAAQVSIVQCVAQAAGAAAVRRRQRLALGVQPTAAELVLHDGLAAGNRDRRARGSTTRAGGSSACETPSGSRLLPARLSRRIARGLPGRQIPG